MGVGRAGVVPTYTHYVSCRSFVHSLRFRARVPSFRSFVISFHLGGLGVVPFVVLVEIFYHTPIWGIGAINGLREVQGAFI